MCAKIILMYCNITTGKIIMTVNEYLKQIDNVIENAKAFYGFNDLVEFEEIKNML